MHDMTYLTWAHCDCAGCDDIERADRLSNRRHHPPHLDVRSVPKLRSFSRLTTHDSRLLSCLRLVASMGGKYIVLVYTGMSIYWDIPVYTSGSSQQIIAGSSRHYCILVHTDMSIYYVLVYRYVLDPSNRYTDTLPPIVVSALCT